MSYKAQLVVRARGKDGVELIETVKEMANEQGVTYSEMAVTLLQQGLNADKAPAPAAEKVAAPAAKEAAPAKKEAPKSAPKAKKKTPLPAEDAGPKVNPDQPPKKIVKLYMERREEMGERAAARILLDFFAVAGPGDGGELKKLLQDAFTNDEYEDIMEPIKDTDEYSTYTERAIFGEPSPYSELK